MYRRCLVIESDFCETEGKINNNVVPKTARIGRKVLDKTRIFFSSQCCSHTTFSRIWGRCEVLTVQLPLTTAVVHKIRFHVESNLDVCREMISRNPHFLSFISVLPVCLEICVWIVRLPA